MLLLPPCPSAPMVHPSICSPSPSRQELLETGAPSPCLSVPDHLVKLVPSGFIHAVANDGISFFFTTEY